MKQQQLHKCTNKKKQTARYIKLLTCFSASLLLAGYFLIAHYGAGIDWKKPIDIAITLTIGLVLFAVSLFSIHQILEKYEMHKMQQPDETNICYQTRLNSTKVSIIDTHQERDPVQLTEFPQTRE